MYRLKQLILLGGDVASLYAGLYLAVCVRYQNWDRAAFDNLVHSIWFVFFFAALVLFIIGLYDVGRARNSRDFFKKITLSALLWMLGSVVIFYLIQLNGIAPKTILLIATTIGFGILALWRFLYNTFLSTTIGQTDVVFAGWSPAVAELIQIFEDEPERGIRVVGVIGAPTHISKLPVAAHLSDFVQKNNGRYPGLVVVDESIASDQALLRDLYAALPYQLSILDLADFYETTLARVPPFTFSETWFITHLHEQQKKIYDRFRILTDYAAALLLMVVFIITYPLLALIIKFTSQGPVLFSQTRVGRGGAIFTIFKYRTMKALTSSGSAEISGAQYASLDDPRITGFGKFLRRTRLDELPQCINILRGEMALIGPRPERPEFVSELTRQMPFYSLRHLVKPGMTGWAQLHQAYYGTIEENLFKLEYDLYYIKNRGPLLDISIALKTIFVVLRMMGR